MYIYIYIYDPVNMLILALLLMWMPYTLRFLLPAVEPHAHPPAGAACPILSPDSSPHPLLSLPPGVTPPLRHLAHSPFQYPTDLFRGFP